MRAIEGVITQIGRAGEIIGSIRRMTARNVEKARDTRAAELFESLMPLLHIYTKNHDIRLTLDLSEIPDSTNIQVRENEIWHVIINLVQNSIEAFNENQESKTIEISAFIDEFCWINICVQDNGPGMNSENLAMVFESFFTTKNGGTGLGLPICREIAELHGGSLIVDSEVGIGTTVTLRLPLSLVDAPGTDHLA